jgi:hypothetical protein
MNSTFSLDKKDRKPLKSEAKTHIRQEGRYRGT